MNSTTELVKRGRHHLKLLFSHQYGENRAVQHIFYQKLTEAMCVNCQTLYGITNTERIFSRVISKSVQSCNHTLIGHENKICKVFICLYIILQQLLI